MTLDPEYNDHSDEPSEPEEDDTFVVTGSILIEEGLDPEGDTAYRFRYTVARPAAIGLLTVITDHLRYREAQGWAQLSTGGDGE